ncbi:MAG TPA: NB-ARC domain-containing protein [Acidimicrobiales bacterium]|nr:NB-ARC domain-containing protein [Acidimicrobiales bacterium]
MPSGGSGGAGGAGGAALIRTFLFTDIEGSTRTWQSAPDGMPAALERHDTILRDEVERQGGVVVKHTGDGILAVFDAPRNAAAAAVQAQRVLTTSVPFSVRMAVATGEAHLRDGDWFGPALNRCARLLDGGHGGQILVSAASAALLRDLPVDGTALHHLGEHRLRDFPEPQSIYQLTAPDLADRHPPLRTAASPVHTLPATRTPLIGREREVTELIGILERTRLLTITGVGGVGKTRLAVELASRRLPQFPGGVFFVALAGVTGSGTVYQAVLTALGIASAMAGGATAEEELIAFLSPREALLVLDNCEHLVDDCADLVNTVLDTCQRTKVITTTREPLGVDGEQVWRTPSLSTDDADADAVRLFVERAGWDPAMAEAGDPRSLVADICRHLDGIPLAIELAAAQTAHLSIGEIAARLGDRFSLLTGGRRRVERQQTLRATVEWSHGLLSEGERALLRRVSAFPGWFDLAAIEAVCGDGLVAPPVRLLGALVGKSLVAPDARRSRYHLLETIRLYAEEQLVAAGEAEEVRERHCRWVFGAIERLGAAGGRTLDGIEVMIDLEDDLRAGLRWSVDRGRLRQAARAISWSGTFWWFAGRQEEGLDWLDAVEDADLSGAERSALLGLRAALLLGRGDPAAVLAATEAARSSDPSDVAPGRLQADVIAALVLLAMPGSDARIDDIIRRASSLDDPYFVRQARDYRGHLLLVTDPEAAVAEWADLVATGDRDQRGIADFFALVDLGGARHLLGDHHGTVEVADELDRRGFSIGRGFSSSAATYLRVLAHVGLGDVIAARSMLEEWSDDLRLGGGRLSMVDCGVACAATFVASGDLEAAARLLGAARGRGSLHMTPITTAIHRHYTKVVLAGLDPAVGRHLYEEARTLDPSGLVRELLRAT